MNDKDFRCYLYEYLENHTLTELMEMVTDAIKSKEEEYQEQIDSVT